MYCDFYSVADRENQMTGFIDALIHEINTGPQGSDNWDFQSIYIGGGTPSLMSTDDVHRILAALSGNVSISNVKEITLEANPGEAPPEKLRSFRENGINRISIGAQSFNPENLKFLGRIHGPDDILKTVSSVKEAGYGNFSLDLIFGLPGQKRQQWRSDLIQAVDLNPGHISAYSLTVEEGTTLDTMVKSGKITMQTDDEQAELIEMTGSILEKHGYSQYEISNYSRPGFACNHNLLYWKGHPFISYGPSAHSFDGDKRWQNVASLEQYMKAIENGISPVSYKETLTPIELTNERIGFGIRMSEGIDISDLPEQFHEEIISNINHAIDKWENCIRFTERRLALTGKGRLFADAIAVDLMI